MKEVEIVQWVESDQEKKRPLRTERLRELLAAIPMAGGGRIGHSSDLSFMAFTELRRCYLDESHLAVVLLSFLYLKNELASALYRTGWNASVGASTSDLVAEARRRNLLGEDELSACEELLTLGESSIRFHAPLSPGSIHRSAVEGGQTSFDYLEGQARRALKVVRIVVDGLALRAT